MATKQDIIKILGVISAGYPNFSPSEQTVEVYWQVLSDLPSDELKAACLHCISESGRKFAPTVGELRGAVGELRGMSSNVPSSFQAWNEFKRVVVSSSYNNPQWSHPLIERTANLIGMREYGRSDVDDEPSWRARFIQCYDQLQSRAERENLLLPEVRGYIEANGGRMLAPVDQMKQLAERMTR
jgi:hypothetical protein